MMRLQCMYVGCSVMYVCTPVDICFVVRALLCNRCIPKAGSSQKSTLPKKRGAITTHSDAQEEFAQVGVTWQWTEYPERDLQVMTKYVCN